MVKSDIQADQMYKLKTIIGVFEPVIAIQRLLGGDPPLYATFSIFRPSVRLSVCPSRTISQERVLLKPGSGPRTQKNLDPEKPGINIGLKSMSDFRELCFIKAIRIVSYCLKVRVLTNI